MSTTWRSCADDGHSLGLAGPGVPARGNAGDVVSSVREGCSIQKGLRTRRDAHPEGGDGLEISSVLASRQDAHRRELIRDVLRSSEVALGTEESPHHGVRGEGVESPLQVSSRDGVAAPWLKRSRAACEHEQRCWKELSGNHHVLSSGGKYCAARQYSRAQSNETQPAAPGEWSRTRFSEGTPSA